MAEGSPPTVSSARTIVLPPNDTLKPDTRVARYRIRALLGRDGFAITYRARDPALERDVVIREFLPTDFAVRHSDMTVQPRAAQWAEDFRWSRERVLAEARALAGLEDAPAILAVLDCLEANGTAYVVTASVPGETLADRLARDGRLPPEVVEILWPALFDGIERMHARGLLHLDIEPANIALDAQGFPTLLDAGQARAQIAARAHSSAMIRTPPAYAALEQSTDGRVVPATDIYGLAATLYHCVTGTPPAGAITRHKEAMAPASRAAAEPYTPGLLAGIDAGLALRAQDRPASIAAWRTLIASSAPVATLDVAQIAPEEDLLTVAPAPRAGPAATTAGVRPGSRTPAPEPASQGSKTGRGRRLGLALVVLAAITAGIGAGYVFRPAVEAPGRTAAPDVATPPAESEARDKSGIETRRRAAEAAQAEQAARQRLEEQARQAAEARRRVAEATASEQAARQRAEAEALAKIEAEAARHRAEEQARREAATRLREEQERARRQAEDRASAELTTLEKAAADAQAAAEADEIRRRAETLAEARRAAAEQAYTEARRKAEQLAKEEAEARRKAEEARALAAERARAPSDAEARVAAEADAARRRAAEQARSEAEAQRRQAEEAARLLAEERARSELTARRKADEEARRSAEEEKARHLAQEQAGAQAEAEARRRSEDDAQAATRQKEAAAAEGRRQAEATERALGLAPREKHRIQVALTALGFDTLGIDGKFGPRTRLMIANWQKRQGAPDTGFLTPPQIAALWRQAAQAIARYDAEEEARREAERRTEETNDVATGPTLDSPYPPPQATLPAAQSVQFTGTGRIALYGGSDPNAFAEYTLTLTVTGRSIGGGITRYCPACGRDGEEIRRTFTCAPATLRGEDSFDLRCDGLQVWGDLRATRLHHSGVIIALPLVPARGADG